LKDNQISNVLKILSVVADLFYADGQTERHDEAKTYFSQFCESAWKRTSAASAKASSLAVRISTSIYCSLLVWHQLRGRL